MSAPEYPRIAIYRDAVVVTPAEDQHDAVIPMTSILADTLKANDLDATTPCGTLDLTLLYAHIEHHPHINHEGTSS